MKIELSPKEFRESFGECIKVLPKKNDMVVYDTLRGVNLNNDLIFGCDGYRFKVRKIKILNEEKINTTLDAHDIKTVLKALRKNKIVTLVIENGSCKAYIDNIYIVNIKLIPGTYINLKSFQHEEDYDYKKIDIEKNYILDFLKTKKEYVYLSIKDNKIENNDDPDNADIVFNTKYLKDALKDYKKNFAIYYKRNNRPFIIKDGKNKTDFVLPVVTRRSK